MCRDAGLAYAYDCVLTAEPAKRAAPAAGLAFVAWLVGIVEIWTTGAL
jgi:hypothetical protein